jgi:hypothetical protein
VPAGGSMKQSRQRGWEIIRFRDAASWLALAYYADKDEGPDFQPASNLRFLRR